MRHLLAAAFVLTFAGAAHAQAPACARIDDSKLPPALAAWAQRTPLPAAATATDLAAAQLSLGRAVDGQLKPGAEVSFPVAPSRTPAAGTHAGLFGLNITEAGDYAISLSAGAWIEVADASGAPVASTDHGHGPECTSLRKSVVFPLKPGRYVVEIAGHAAPSIVVMAARRVP